MDLFVQKIGKKFALSNDTKSSRNRKKSNLELDQIELEQRDFSKNSKSVLENSSNTETEYAAGASNKQFVTTNNYSPAKAISKLKIDQDSLNINGQNDDILTGSGKFLDGSIASQASSSARGSFSSSSSSISFCSSDSTYGSNCSSDNNSEKSNSKSVHLKVVGQKPRQNQFQSRLSPPSSANSNASKNRRGSSDKSNETSPSASTNSSYLSGESREVKDESKKSRFRKGLPRFRLKRKKNKSKKGKTQNLEFEEKNSPSKDKTSNLTVQSPFFVVRHSHTDFADSQSKSIEFLIELQRQDTCSDLSYNDICLQLTEQNYEDSAIDLDIYRTGIDITCNSPISSTSINTPNISLNDDVAKTTNDKTQVLRRILLAFSFSHPLIRYCQGMNTIVAFLLMFLKEQQAFYGLCILIARRPENYYKHLQKILDDTDLLRYYIVLHFDQARNIFQTNSNKLQNGFTFSRQTGQNTNSPRSSNSKISLESNHVFNNNASQKPIGQDLKELEEVLAGSDDSIRCCFKQFATVFTSVLPYDTSLFIMAKLFSSFESLNGPTNGDEVMFKSALTVFKMYEEELCNPNITSLPALISKMGRKCEVADFTHHYNDLEFNRDQQQIRRDRLQVKFQNVKHEVSLKNRSFLKYSSSESSTAGFQNPRSSRHQTTLTSSLSHSLIGR